APTPIYELTGTIPARSRLQAGASRGLTRFVGRDRELEQLVQAFERSAVGHGQAVAVVGEAGVGKSRLAWEFTRSHRVHGWLVLRESQVQPLLLLFEDLHWIDSDTQALLDGLMESLPTARILLLVNYRPEYQHAWGGKTYYLQLRIDPLRPESADALLTALL